MIVVLVWRLDEGIRLKGGVMARILQHSTVHGFLAVMKFSAIMRFSLTAKSVFGLITHNVVKSPLCSGFQGVCSPYS